jgi:SAM-dependent methyltransferase
VYYADKIESLKTLFGVEDIALETGGIRVGKSLFPILHDVIILLDPERYTGYVAGALRAGHAGDARADGEADRDIQFTFGEEWKEYGEVLEEHAREFAQYFDLADMDSLKGQRVCDLGCGNGRFSYFLKDRCRELILVDFSDAIFVARKNLAEANNALFFMADLQALPFRNDFCDFLVCLGVLHHLPTPCLEAVRELRNAAPRILVFLYYALDNRPWYFRLLLTPVTFLRRLLWRVRHPGLRKAFARAMALLLYRPLVALGTLVRPIGLSRYVPLYEFYRGKSLCRIEQDVYDRFFTRIEQRVSRQDIRSLQGSFAQVLVSDHLPYWHFLCVR